jgi:methionine-rich copper-binding protein CopC
MRLRRRPVRVGAVLAAALVGAALWPLSALGRAPVVGTSPHDGARVSSVRGVDVRFGEPVITGLISVKNAGGTVVRARLAGLTGDRRRLREVFPRRLRRGRYTVRWVVLAADGAQQRGTFRFTVR